MLMCASKMLRHVNLQKYSESIRNAIREVLAAGKVSVVEVCYLNFTLKYILYILNYLFNLKLYNHFD